MRVAALQAQRGMPEFGAYRVNVTKEDYLAALDTDPRSLVVVHLYEPTMPKCRTVNRCLDLLRSQRVRRRVTWAHDRLQYRRQDFANRRAKLGLESLDDPDKRKVSAVLGANGGHRDTTADLPRMK